MSEQRSPFVLREGKTHFITDADGNQVPAPAGMVIELTKAGAAAFADRFEPLAVVEARAREAAAVAGIAVEQLKQPEPAEAIAAELEAPAPAAVEALPDLSSMNAPDAIKAIRAIGDPATLRRLKDLEADGKARVSVIRAADECLAELAG